jgi:hypothetical protein
MVVKLGAGHEDYGQIFFRTADHFLAGPESPTQHFHPIFLFFMVLFKSAMKRAYKFLEMSEFGKISKIAVKFPAFLERDAVTEIFSLENDAAQ